MSDEAIALWGFFTGLCAMLLAGAAAAFSRSLHRLGWTIAIYPLSAGSFCLIYLNAFNVGDTSVLTRLQAHSAAISSCAIFYALLLSLGAVASPAQARLAGQGLPALCVAVLAIGWALSPMASLALSLLVLSILASVVLAITLANGLRNGLAGARPFLSLFSMSAAISGLVFSALNQQAVSVGVQVLTALAANLFASLLGFVLWSRYAYLVDLRQVMRFGDQYDPVTQLAAPVASDALINQHLARRGHPTKRASLVVVTVANLMALDKLHGGAATHNALFLMAMRLKKSSAGTALVGRLGSNQFFVVTPLRHVHGYQQAAHRLKADIDRSSYLQQSVNLSDIDRPATRWHPDIGMGVVLLGEPQQTVTEAIKLAQDLAQTAVSFGSRVAWLDIQALQIVELPPGGQPPQAGATCR